MARTVSKYVKVYIDSASAALTQLTSINTIGGIGLDFPEEDRTAWADALQGVLLGIPSFSTTIGGVFDTVDHAVLEAINGLNVPLSFDVQLGIVAAWTTGMPQFGITSSATAGVLLRNYIVDPSAMTWSGDIVMFPGSTAPGWGTAAET